MEFFIILSVIIGVPTMFALYKLVQRKRNYRKAMEHWNKLQRRIEEGEDNGYVD